MERQKKHKRNECIAIGLYNQSIELQQSKRFNAKNGKEGEERR